MSKKKEDKKFVAIGTEIAAEFYNKLKELKTKHKQSINSTINLALHRYFKGEK